MASLEPKKFESAPPGGPAIQSFSDVAKTKEAIQQEVNDFCGRDVFTQMDKTKISTIVDKIQTLMVDKQNYQDLAPLLSSLKSLAAGIAAHESEGADGGVKANELRDRVEGVKKSSLGLITRPVGDKVKDKFSDLEFVSDLPALKATITALGDIFSSIFLKTDITQEDVNKLSNFTQTAEKLSIDPTYKILIPLVAQLKQTHRALTEALAKESSAAGGKGTVNINEPSLKREIDGIREQFIKIHTLLSESDELTPGTLEVSKLDYFHKDLRDDTFVRMNLAREEIIVRPSNSEGFFMISYMPKRIVVDPSYIMRVPIEQPLVKKDKDGWQLYEKNNPKGGHFPTLTQLIDTQYPGNRKVTRQFMDERVQKALANLAKYGEKS